MLVNKSGFEIGDRVRIHMIGNIPNCCEGKTGIVVGIYDGTDTKFHGAAKVILDDKDGCFDFDGELEGEYGILCDQDNAVLIERKIINLEELI